MRIAVYGAGGVGGYFGGRLAEVGHDVHFIARGAHLEALRENGLTIQSARGDAHLDVPATKDPEDIGPVEVVLFCVKSTDTESAASLLKPLLEPGTAVVSLQNGVDNEEKLARVIGQNHVVGGVCFILSTISAPGVLQHVGSTARMLFGELSGNRSERTEKLLEACEPANFDAAIAGDIRVALWDRLSLICAVAGMTATVGLTVGEIRDTPASLAMYRELADEVARVARAEGIPLPEETADRHVEMTLKLDGDWRSSLHYDMVHGKPMELDSLHGVVLRLAEKHGLDVPANLAVYAILQPWANRNRRGSSA